MSGDARLYACNNLRMAGRFSMKLVIDVCHLRPMKNRTFSF
jgi:hypothetical protein